MSRRRFSQAEDQFIRDNAGQMMDRDVAASLSRMGQPVSQLQVQARRLRLGIKKMHGRGRCQIDTPATERAVEALRARAAASGSPEEE